MPYLQSVVVQKKFVWSHPKVILKNVFMWLASAGHACTKILKPATLKSYVLTECNGYITEDNPEPRTEFWEWFVRNMDTMFKDITVSSDKATFKLIGTTTKPCYVIPWGPHNHMEEVLNFPGFPV
jgi:hypothetical protein